MVITNFTFFQKVARGSRTQISPVPWTAKGWPSAPRIQMSRLGFTSRPSLAACQAGMSETDAPVSKRTFVGGISLETDFGGTFFAMSKL